MKKKICLSLSLLLVVSMFLVACGGDKTPKNDSANNKVESKEQVENKEDSEKTATVDFKAEEPVLLTTVGQSADVEMVKAILDNLTINYKMNNLAKTGEIGDAKTLILAVGGSSKGLGAAGIDANAELERVNGLIEDAKSNGVKIIAMHIGGEARRGELSDKFIKPSFENADYAIVVSEGDKDGLIKGIGESKNVPVEYIDQMSKALDSLKVVFNK